MSNSIFYNNILFNYTQIKVDRQKIYMHIIQFYYHSTFKMEKNISFVPQSRDS